MIRSGASAFSYDRASQPRPKIDPWRLELDEILSGNARRPKRERLTLVRIYEELRNLGYDGGYDAVRRYAADWSKAREVASKDAYVPLSFDPGEAYQFDWSHEIVVLDGVTTTVKVAHVRLCYSRMPFVRAYPRESQEMVFDAHDKAFAFFGGACARGIYDYVPGHVIVVLCPERLCALQPVDPTVLDGSGAHNDQRPASHSSSFWLALPDWSSGRSHRRSRRHLTRLKRLLLHPDADLGISVGRIQADVAKPTSYDVHIDAGFE